MMAHIDTNGTVVQLPGSIIRQALENEDIEEEPRREYPPWAPLLCWNREFFCKCIIKVEEPAGVEPHIYKFLFAMQNPYLVCMMRLEEDTVPAPRLADVGHAAFMRDSFDHVFKFEIGDNRIEYSDDGVWSAASKITVLTNVRHLYGLRVWPMATGTVGRRYPDGSRRCRSNRGPKMGVLETTSGRATCGQTTRGWQSG